MGGFILRLYTPPRTTRSHERYASMSRYRVWIFPAALLIESGGNRRVNLEVTGVRADSCARRAGAPGGQNPDSPHSALSVVCAERGVSATRDVPRVRVVAAHDTSRYSMPFWQKNRAEYMGAVARPRTALGRRWWWRQQRRRRRRRRVRTRARGGGGDGGRAAPGQEDQEGSEKLRRLLGLVRDGEARHCLSRQFSGWLTRGSDEKRKRRGILQLARNQHL